MIWAYFPVPVGFPFSQCKSGPNYCGAIEIPKTEAHSRSFRNYIAGRTANVNGQNFAHCSAVPFKCATFASVSHTRASATLLLNYESKADVGGSLSGDKTFSAVFVKFSQVVQMLKRSGEGWTQTYSLRYTRIAWRTFCFMNKLR